MAKTESAEKAKTKIQTVGEKNVSKRKTGLSVKRIYTKKGVNPLDEVEYELRSSKIINPDGSVVFEMNDIEIPVRWSRVASDILISKYIRKNGVPQYGKDGNLLKDENGKVIVGSEKSIKQVIGRIAGCWRWWGENYKYFASKEDAQAFEDEIKFMLINQYAAPNSPQWFNTGLNFAYKITGPAQGHWYADPKSGKLKQSEDAYTHPQPHACFIQSVNDDLVNKGGIFDLIVREARIFKYGSGSGSNFSALRAKGESLSGGGHSTGLMSWLEIFDKAAGAIKSGGTTRRAAKMVVLNVDHPEIETFINWKHVEEEKAAALIAQGYSAGLEGQAYQTVSGQNSNNTVRVNDDFMHAVETDSDWYLRWRTNPDHIEKTVKAKELWEKIAKSTWECGDPGLQYDTTINDWHTCLTSGRINASNPCSEFMFLDDSSCNLASLNLMKFYSKDGFDIDAFSHASRLWTMVLEISVLMAQFPSYEIAKNSYLFRPLGLGYANLGALLMTMGLPYDSEKGRAVSAGITSLMTGVAYKTSAEMADALGPFKMYEKNKDDMLKVIQNHRLAAYSAQEEEFTGLSKAPLVLDEQNCPKDLLEACRSAWDEALLEGGQSGYRNAQVTLLAPTGTIGLAMDCDTTGVEPDYAIVKLKKLAGGGYFKIINQSVPQALENLGYSQDQIEAIITYVIGTGSLEGSPHINKESLLRKGFNSSVIDVIEQRLKGAFDISGVFSKETIGEANLQSIGIKPEKYNLSNFNLLNELGFSQEQIAQANEVICGVMTIEGSPELKDEHLAIFDCANKCGAKGVRYIEPKGHIKMMASVQPFLSGAISKTVNLPNNATVEDIEAVYFKSWEYGLKAVAIYRDGSKLSQPLNVSKEAEKEVDVEKEVVVEYRPVRKRLPKERMSVTRKVMLGGHKIFLTVGLYKDGKPGELFITMNQQGSFAAGMADSFAKMVSIGLQYGVPVETIINQLRHSRFQPMGFTGDPDITNVASVVDFIAQWFQQKFVDGGLKSMKLPFDEDLKGEVADKKQKEEKSELSTLNLRNKSESEQNLELGFSGETCPECGSNMMVQNGKCHKCVNCGATTGCS